MVDHIQLAQLCADAYTVPPAISDEHQVARCTIQRLDDFNVVAFPGTVPINVHDDLADMDMATVNIPRLGHVHEGFWNATQGIAAQLDERLGDRPLILTGHSLGGAVALCYAGHRIISMKPVWGIVTFGAPHVSLGQSFGCTLKGIPVYLYRHNNDPVPELPLRIPGVADWQQPDKVTQLADGGGIPSIADHMILAYVAALKLAKRGQL